MPEFQMNGKDSDAFTALDAFTQAYIEAAFFTEEEQLRDMAKSDDQADAVGVDTLAPATLQRMIEDCAKFQICNAALLRKAQHDRVGNTDEAAGHDFWLTRNGHGAGFWDGDWPEPYATQLSEACESFGEVNLYLGDDGLIYS